ncbi:hypothetical protein PHYSODRAFT_309542 [Phytophthora sojae]|uniref:Uncharacterized protein n=1 Tax=Phytophthora sojae (strain P6497) TaxID=1094619 RepID=G4YIX7_PHYSP|nr:hypothetical protein PHYSODRAFT_309542 [Phytophthora sojae]EGZ28799.1 hypothetical protein PHYSODRAFT_309542 [Phytophthora sojae]|eukprot:XP_009516074.1 hypothetical protein PHYSODRAFT_309542 [Phytophthora sojae]
MNRSKDKGDKERYLTYSITEWSAEDKFRNARVLLEGDLLDQLDQQLIAGDDDVRMDDKEFNSALYKASVVVMPVDYAVKIQEELWEIRKLCSESRADYNKRFRTLVRMEHVVAELHGGTHLAEDALCRLYKRGLPFEWQSKYDSSGQSYLTIATLVPYFERIEQGEQRLQSRNHSRDNNSNYRPGGNRGQGRGRGRCGGFGGNNSHQNNSRNQQQRNQHRGNGGNNSGGNKYCIFHRTSSHSTQECRVLHGQNQQDEHQQADHERSFSSRGRGGRGAGSRPSQTFVERRSQRDASSSDEEYMFVGLQDEVKRSQPPMRAMIKLEHGKEHYKALLDSGCSRSLVSAEFA